MLETNNDFPAVLVVGDGKLTYSIVSMLLRAHQKTTLLTADVTSARSAMERIAAHESKELILLTAWPESLAFTLIIAITAEDSLVKQQLIQQLENRIGNDALIAINTESVPLDELQAGSRFPQRIIGLNWCYPADLTLFMEIICNAASPPQYVHCLEQFGRIAWGKDPYTVRSGFSIRARMMAAWAREAFYLVENGYASLESIDRACRNDAGYYLPFAGNFRYMDLMGTYAYGTVMKDLNPELSDATQMSTFIEQLLTQGKTGAGKDFYPYHGDEELRWEEIHRDFSREILELMQRYHTDDKKTDH